MGTGIPTTPTYIILASIAAPALGTLGVPLVATHFFVFYYGVLADVTPPVALAAYAAAGIAGSEPMRTGLTAFRLSMGKALVPFMFVYTPSLLFLDFQWPAFLSGARLRRDRHPRAVGRLHRIFSRADRTLGKGLLTVAGLVLVFNNLWANIVGCAVVLGLLGWNALAARQTTP